MQISGYVFPLLTFPYITRVLGPEKYGIVVFSNAVINYFQLFVDFGFLLSATRVCALSREIPDQLSEVICAVIQGKLILFSIGFVALLGCCSISDTFSDKRTYLLLSYISVGLSILLPDFYFRGIEKMSIIT
jgi:PST family polysaccharide transporter